MLEEATQTYSHISDTGPACAYLPRKGGSIKFYPCYHPAGQALPEPLLSESQSGPPPSPSRPCELLALGPLKPNPSNLHPSLSWPATWPLGFQCYTGVGEGLTLCSLPLSCAFLLPGSAGKLPGTPRFREGSEGKEVGQQLQNRKSHWNQGRDGARSLPSEQPNP